MTKNSSDKDNPKKEKTSKLETVGVPLLVAFLVIFFILVALGKIG